jgi:hypothetical protein
VKTDYDTENRASEIQKPKPKLNRTTEKTEISVRFGFRFMVKKCPPLGSMDPKKDKSSSSTQYKDQYPVSYLAGGKGAVGVMAVRLLRLLEPRAEAPLPH